MNLPTTTHTKGDFLFPISLGNIVSIYLSVMVHPCSSDFSSSQGTKIFKSEDQILSKEPELGLLWISENIGNLSEGIVMKKPTAMLHTFRSLFFGGGSGGYTNRFFES